jgi:hypothetical protein
VTRIPIALLAVAFLASPVAGAEAQSSKRVVDRSFSCMTRDGDLDLTAYPHTVFPSTSGGPDEFVAAHVLVSSGAYTLDSDLVAVRARRYQWFTNRVQNAGVYANRLRCSTTRTRVPLSRKGLAGAPVQWYKQVSCVVPGRVLVHVRATLAGSADWERSGAFEGAEKAVTEAKVAVRAASTRKPIAYMELTGGKKTKIWYSGGCR